MSATLAIAPVGYDAVKKCPDCGRMIPGRGMGMHRPGEGPCRAVEPHVRALPRFLAMVQRTDGCWMWIGHIHVRSGYGYFAFRGRPRMAHRFSYEAVNGPIPEGKVLDHLCRVRHCVNPEHLECVTQSINLLRGYAARREGQ